MEITRTVTIQATKIFEVEKPEDIAAADATKHALETAFRAYDQTLVNVQDFIAQEGGKDAEN